MRDHHSNPDAFEPAFVTSASTASVEALRHAARSAASARRPVTAASALAIRILSERSRAAQKAGPSSDADADAGAQHDLERVTEALRELRRLRPVQSEVLAMHALAGLSLDEVATTLGMSEEAAQRELRDAMLWMAKHLPD